MVNLLGEGLLLLSSLISLALRPLFIPRLRDRGRCVPLRQLCIRPAARLYLVVSLVMAVVCLHRRESRCRVPPSPPSPLATRTGK